MRIYGILFIIFAASNLPSGQLHRTLDKAKSAAEHVVEHVIADVEKVVVATTLKNCLYSFDPYFNIILLLIKIQN